MKKKMTNNTEKNRPESYFVAFILTVAFPRDDDWPSLLLSPWLYANKAS